jgi:diguanylate cyclase
MVTLVIAQKISSGDNFDMFGGIGRLFSLIAGVVRRAPEVETDNAAPRDEPQAPIDPREQKLYDSTQAIKNILLVLASSIHRTDQAANDSSLALVDVKSAIKTMELPTDLREAHTILMHEIDHVISNNNTLKDELAKSQSQLTEQRHQIEHLRTAVRIDGLTQLANRTTFDEKLEEMIKLRKRYRDPFSLLMVDLDNFKTINDSYGHPAGDRILKGVALKIKASLRGSDFLARFGGDEYALILIKTDLETATEVAWKLCEEVRASRFVLDETALSMTLSIGVAEANDDDTEETLLKRADKALYRTKAAGRNGVSTAES